MKVEMEDNNLLASYSEVIGVSGYEELIRDTIRENITKQVAGIQLNTDRIGNLMCHIEGQIKAKIKLMIIAHMDEVGFQVMHVDEDGNAVLKTLGNIKTWNMLNQRISTADGKKKGIIVCDDPEDLKAYDYEKVKCVPTIGEFQIGDVLGFETEFKETDSLYIGKAIDNRISCFILSQLLSSKIQSRYNVDFVFSVQEESGMRGARVAVAECMPDIILDIDVSPINNRNSLKMGKGVGIKLSDSIGISSGILIKQVEKYAEDNKIPFQREVSECGTSELIITNEKDSGALRLGISIPCKNMHSSLTIIEKKDIRACQSLLKCIIEQGLEEI